MPNRALVSSARCVRQVRTRSAAQCGRLLFRPPRYRTLACVLACGAALRCAVLCCALLFLHSCVDVVVFPLMFLPGWLAGELWRIHVLHVRRLPSLHIHIIIFDLRPARTPASQRHRAIEPSHSLRGRSFAFARPSVPFASVFLPACANQANTHTHASSRFIFIIR